MAKHGNQVEHLLPRELLVTVSLVDDKFSKKRLGVDVDWADGETLYIKAVLSGAVEDWNREHGFDESVRAGDRIIAVNGCSGDAQAMVRECRDCRILQLLVRRADMDIAEEIDSVASSVGNGLPNVVCSRAGQQSALEKMALCVAKHTTDRLHAAQARAEPSHLAAELPDYYSVLGLQDQGADDSDVKKNYRKLVLRSSTDKHLDEHNKAELQLGLINKAYETLVNPMKRINYDLVLAAVQRKKAGICLDTSLVVPRMNIPHEFMVCPLGHVDSFVRFEGHGLQVRCREDMQGVSFKDFFQAAKFGLWWLPEENGVCRIRVRPSVELGIEGGLHFTFDPDDDGKANIMLSSSQDARRVNFVAVTSPFSDRAFRFESALCPGLFLTFCPPSSLHMSSLADNNSGNMVDMMLVDHSAASTFITVGEVLAGAVEGHGGYMKLSDLRADLSVRMYFQQILGCTAWNNKDFETFFEGHPDQWDFDQKRARVRLRLRDFQQQQPMEDVNFAGFAELLQNADNCLDVVQAILCISNDKLNALSINLTIWALQRLAEPLAADVSSGAQADLIRARRRLILALPLRLRSAEGATQAGEMPLAYLLTLHKTIMATVANMPNAAAPEDGFEEARTELLKRVSGFASLRIARCPHEISCNILADLFAVRLEWRVVAEPLRESVERLLTSMPTSMAPGSLLEALQGAVKQGREARPVAEKLAQRELQAMHRAEGSIVADVLISMVTGSVLLQEAAVRLRSQLVLRLPLPELVRLVAVYAERGIGEDAVRQILQAKVAVAGPGLATVPQPQLLRLAMAAAKSAVVTEFALGPVAGAAAANLASWPVGSIAELLLVVATKDMVHTCSGARRLFAEAFTVLAPKLWELEPAALLKTVVAAGTAVALCRGLLEAAADVAILRISDFRPEQVLLLTQGIMPLGPRHNATARLLDFWTQHLAANATEKEGVQELSADEVADLARLLAMVAPGHISVFEAIALRLTGSVASKLSATGRASLRAAFAGECGPDFPRRAEMVAMALDDNCWFRGRDAKLRLSSRSRSR